jgi:3-isopropylmalate dehydrogenase
MEAKGVKRVTVIPGDGIGKEVMAQALLVIRKIESLYGHCIETQEALAGGCALDAVGVPLPEATLDLCKQSQAVLLGAVGGPKWDNHPPELKPEKGILGLRAGLGLFANLRPAHVYPTLINASSLKPEVLAGVNLLIVRELTGGIYFGQPRGISKIDGQEVGINTEIYRTSEIERIARVAFEAAGKRRHRVTSVDKANVLESSQLWRQVVTAVGRRFPDVSLNHIYVDNCAMQLIANPGQFDVIVTSNLFGDILSDEASMLTGSIGMLPSASLGGRIGLFEPVHGTAPDIAGQDLANPIAMIASVAMMFKYAFGMAEEADAIERAITSVLESGYRTADLMEAGGRPVGTQEMGRLILERLDSQNTNR